MKIRCDKCHSVFLIEDKLISDKGVKAQCPKCGEQKIVWKQSITSNMQSFDSSALGGLNDPLTSNQNIGDDYGFSDYNPPDYESSNDYNPPDYAPLSDYAPSDSNYGFDDFNTSNPASYDEQAEGGGGITPIPFGADPMDFGSVPQDNYSSAVEEEHQVTCFKCGKPMKENPDTVLPICPSCLQSQQEDISSAVSSFSSQPPEASFTPSPEPEELSPAQSEEALSPDLISATSMVYTPHSEPDHVEADPIPAIDPMPEIHSEPAPSLPLDSDSSIPFDSTRIKLRQVKDHKEIGPISLQEVRSLYAHGKISLDDEYLYAENQWKPITQVPELYAVLRRTPQIGDKANQLPPHATKRNILKKETSSSGKKIVLAFVMAIILGAVAFGGFYYWQQNSDHHNRARKITKHTQNNILNYLRKKWHNDSSPKKIDKKLSALLTQKGMDIFRTDDFRGYRAAMNFFKKAIIANPHNYKAIAAVALSFLWGAQGEPSIEHLNEFDGLLRQEAYKTRQPILQAAYAVFLARQGETEKSLRFVKRALRKNKKSALIFLIAGELLLEQEKSHQKAIRYLKRSTQLDPKLFRARYYLAYGLQQTAHHYTALQSLSPLIKKRHLKALYLKAKIQIELGYYRQATTSLLHLLKKQPNIIKARLLLGILYYQFLNSRSRAAYHLRKAYRMDPSKRLKKKIILHRGYIAIEQRQLKTVKKFIKQLRKIDRHYLPILLLEAEYFFLKKRYHRASKILKNLISQISDPKIQIFLAYIIEKQGNSKATAEMYRNLIEENSRYILPYLLQAAYYAKRKNDTQIAISLKNSLDIEPDLFRHQLRPTRFYIPPSFWRETLYVFQKSRVGDRSITAAAAGITAYYLGQLQLARQWLRRAIRYDRSGLASNLYFAQYSLRIKNYRLAQRHAKKVYLNYNQPPVAGTILGWTAYHRKRYAQALDYFKQVKEARPWYISPPIGIALTLAKQGKRDKAIQLLLDLLRSHKHHHQLLRALYELKW